MQPVQAWSCGYIVMSLCLSKEYAFSVANEFNLRSARKSLGPLASIPSRLKFGLVAGSPVSSWPMALAMATLDTRSFWFPSGCTPRLDFGGEVDNSDV